jgi:Zn finger protein HypA/HybF involved in hydrogenase expression
MRAKFNVVRTVKNGSNTMRKVSCLECDCTFGVSIESKGEGNFKPTCPSCGGKKCKIESGILLTYGYLKTECPKCKNIFGLETKKIEKMSEVDIRYSCPYCSYDAGIND